MAQQLLKKLKQIQPKQPTLPKPTDTSLPEKKLPDSSVVRDDENRRRRRRHDDHNNHNNHNHNHYHPDSFYELYDEQGRLNCYGNDDHDHCRRDWHDHYFGCSKRNCSCSHTFPHYVPSVSPFYHFPSHYLYPQSTCYSTARTLPVVVDYQWDSLGYPYPIYSSQMCPPSPTCYY
jgi:hypothetical protein